MAPLPPLDGEGADPGFVPGEAGGVSLLWTLHLMTTIDLNPVQSIARDDAVLKALAGFVRQESLEPGSKLPTERVLADLLKVSRNTVREALTRWAAEVGARHGAS